MFGGIEKFQTDPHWHDLLLFHEYFHGDNGAGLGASHQTGWTGTVALLFLLGGAVETEPRLGRRAHRLMRLPARPTVYEINTAVWLAAAWRPLRSTRCRPREWDALGRAAGRRRVADGRVGAQPGRAGDRRGRSGARRRQPAALPDLRTEDVIGSPYCVRDYVVDERFGGRDALATRAPQLAARGLGLILDYVPNHVAPDHPWLTERPGCLVAGTEDELAARPGGVPPHRRRASSPAGATRTSRPGPTSCSSTPSRRELRDAVAETLIDVGAQCDGLRCDMAMLMTNEVFARTWGGARRPPGGVLAAR